MAQHRTRRLDSIYRLPNIQRTNNALFSKRSTQALCGLIAVFFFTPSLLAQPNTALQAALTMEKALVDTIAKCDKSVVAIARVRKDESRESRDPNNLPVPTWNNGPGPESPDFIPNEFGSGVVIDRRGLIVTNAHVLGDVRRSDYYVWVARKSYRAEVKAVDPWLDLAVLKVDAKNLQPVTFGNASNLRKGQIVIALGNPYAIARDGSASASWGIIANLSRQAAPRKNGNKSPRRETLHHFGTLIHTDAKLNLGTSGGALVNLQGEMVGLTTSLSALSGYEKSAGFAVPVDATFRRAIDTLKLGRVPEYGFLGVEPVNLSKEEQDRGMIGARVREVIHGTPAFVAGIQRNDVLTHVNGVAVQNATHLILQLSSFPANSQARLTVLRSQNGNQPIRQNVLLSKKFVESARRAYSEQETPAWRGLQVDYSTAIPSAQFLQRANDIDVKGCVAITKVEPQSAAWKAGLRPYSFVSHVGGIRIKTPSDFYRAVKGHAGGSVLIHLTGSSRTPRIISVAP